MRWLACPALPLDPKLGGAKVYLEIAAALARLGWETALAGSPEVASPGSPLAYPDRLRAYLRDRAAGFDVVEYEHNTLPYPRTDFPAGPLFVARSMLLTHHQLAIEIPPLPGLLRGVRHRLLRRSRRRGIERLASVATRTCREADLVSVSTADDAAVLAVHGVPSGKVFVQPYGLSAARRAELGAAGTEPPPRPVVGFLGTFDPRKGMRDFPRIVAAVAAAVPEARFRLLGTQGLLKTGAEVRAAFPHRLRARLDVEPSFDPADLPRLLADCSVGMFPSAVEGFPFGALEMLAAAVPVVAYRVPGPTAMLPEEHLVPRGDAAGMASRIAALLLSPEGLRAARAGARRRAADFDWDDIARKTADRYRAEIAWRRRNAR